MPSSALQIGGLQDSDLKFNGVGRLYSPGALARLRAAHVCVIGVGGVGSWVAEALARSAVGKISLVDLDEVCVSNFNRQAMAVEGFVGKPKVEAMAERIRLIDPGCQVIAHHSFFTESTEHRIFHEGCDAVVDAIDSVSNKVRLIQACLSRNLPLIMSGAAGARVQATSVQIGPLADVHHDRLMAAVRREIKTCLTAPDRERALSLPCVFSGEKAREMTSDSCQTDQPTGRKLTCESGYGSAVFVTGSFGFAAAGWVVNLLAGPAGRLTSD